MGCYLICHRINEVNLFHLSVCLRTVNGVIKGVHHCPPVFGCPLCSGHIVLRRHVVENHLTVLIRPPPLFEVLSPF